MCVFALNLCCLSWQAPFVLLQAGLFAKFAFFSPLYLGGTSLEFPLTKFYTGEETIHSQIPQRIEMGLQIMQDIGQAFYVPILRQLLLRVLNAASFLHNILLNLGDTLPFSVQVLQM